MATQILGDVPVRHPRHDDRWNITVMEEHAIEVEDVRARHVLPDDHLFTEALNTSSNQPVPTCCASAVTFFSLIKVSWPDVLRTFTATSLPSRFPRYTSAHVPDVWGRSGSVTVAGSIQ